MTDVANAPIFTDLLDIHAFVEVAANESFAKAARRLNEPRATISRRITRLEDRARTRLFERTTRSVQITTAGALLLQHAQRMLEEQEAARISLEQLVATPSGSIRMTAPVILGQTLLGPILSDFIRRFPECTPFLILSNSSFDLVADGYDLAIRVGSLSDSSMIARRLGSVEAALYASPKLNLDIQDPKALEGLPLLKLGGDASANPMLTIRNKNGDSETIRTVLKLQSTEPHTLLDAALSGQGAAILPTFIGAEHVRQGTLIRILPDYATNRPDVHILTTSRRYVRPAVRAFVEFAAAHLTKALSE